MLRPTRRQITRRRRTLALVILAAIALAWVSLSSWMKSQNPMLKLKTTLHLENIKSWETATRLRSRNLNGLVLETWQFRLAGTLSQAYLLRPNDATLRKRPAILLLHGHYVMPEDVVGLSFSDWMWPAGQTLAHHGFIVLVPHIRYYEPKKPMVETLQGLKLLLSGKTLMGERVADAVRYGDFLEQHEIADSQRLGLLGWSMGGHMALYAAALDERFKAVYLSNALSSLKKLQIPDEPLHTPDNYIPGILKNFGDKDLAAAMIAPRPLYVEHGANDTSEPLSFVLPLIENIATVYKKKGKAERLVFKEHQHGHFFDGHEAVAWFLRWLSPEP